MITQNVLRHPSSDRLFHSLSSLALVSSFFVSSLHWELCRLLPSLGTLSFPPFTGNVDVSSPHWELYRFLPSLGTLSSPPFTGNVIVSSFHWERYRLLPSLGTLSSLPFTHSLFTTICTLRFLSTYFHLRLFLLANFIKILLTPFLFLSSITLPE